MPCVEHESRSRSLSAAAVRRIRRAGIAIVVLALAVVPLACDFASPGGISPIYTPRNAHQAYGHSLAQASLIRTALGRDWLAAAETALAAPAELELPFADHVVFEAAEPRALGYSFRAAAGDRLEVSARVEADEPLQLFVDLFAATGDGLEHVASAPPTFPGPGRGYRVEWEALEDALFVLRVQPELLRSGKLEVAVRRMPLLAFPVTGLDLRAIQSGFGAERDGGRRAHRGVDIFAARGTETVAALDAFVARVDTTPRGGNVVWLQPLFGNMRLYYAHLDTQVVREGQFVRAGDVVGTVGNTGNAVTTPPHLHFGVYLRRRGMRGGARDPYVFLD